jgi:acetyl/propionyl-CoA carboxylase alpha subunit
MAEEEEEEEEEDAFARLLAIMHGTEPSVRIMRGQRILPGKTIVKFTAMITNHPRR